MRCSNCGKEFSFISSGGSQLFMCASCVSTQRLQGEAERQTQALQRAAVAQEQALRDARWEAEKASHLAERTLAKVEERALAAEAELRSLNEQRQAEKAAQAAEEEARRAMIARQSTCPWCLKKFSHDTFGACIDAEQSLIEVRTVMDDKVGWDLSAWNYLSDELHKLENSLETSQKPLELYPYCSKKCHFDAISKGEDSSDEISRLSTRREKLRDDISEVLKVGGAKHKQIQSHVDATLKALESWKKSSSEFPLPVKYLDSLGLSTLQPENVELFLKSLVQLNPLIQQLIVTAVIAVSSPKKFEFKASKNVHRFICSEAGLCFTLRPAKYAGHRSTWVERDENKEMIPVGLRLYLQREDRAPGYQPCKVSLLEDTINSRITRDSVDSVFGNPESVSVVDGKVECENYSWPEDCSSTVYYEGTLTDNRAAKALSIHIEDAEFIAKIIGARQELEAKRKEKEEQERLAQAKLQAEEKRARQLAEGEKIEASFKLELEARRNMRWVLLILFIFFGYLILNVLSRKAGY